MNEQSRKTFGRLHKKRSSAKRAMNLCEHAGWINPQIEPVILGGLTYYKVTAYPIFKRIQQMHGTVTGNISNPIHENPKFRHASRYRHKS